MFIYPTRDYNALSLLAAPHNIKSPPLEQSQSTLSLKYPPQPVSPRVRKPVKILLPEQRVKFVCVLRSGFANRMMALALWLFLRRQCALVIRRTYL